MSGITSNEVMYDRLVNLRYKFFFFGHIIHYQLRIHAMKHFSVLFTCQFINKTPRGGIRSVVGREGSLTKYGNEARNCGADEIELIPFIV